MEDRPDPVTYVRTHDRRNQKCPHEFPGVKGACSPSSLFAVSVFSSEYGAITTWGRSAVLPSLSLRPDSRIHNGPLNLPGC